MKPLVSVTLALLAVAQANAQVWYTHGVTTKLEDLYTAAELQVVTVEPADPTVIDHWEVGIFRPLVSLITPFSVTSYPLTLVSCGHLKQEEAPENAPNPVSFSWDDPADPALSCIIDTKTLVASLPLGVGYKAGARACNAANVCSPWSLLSRTFRRAPRGIPCPTGGTQSTVDVDIDGQPVHVTICVQR